MNIKAILTAALLALSPVTSASAATLDFNFTLTEVRPDNARTLIGTIYGLTDNTVSAASSLMVEFTPNILTRQLYTDTDATANSFEVKDGQITRFGFIAPGSAVNPPIGGAFSLQQFAGPESGVYRCSFLLCTGMSEFVRVEFTQVPAVPLPAGGLLLLTAVGGFAALKRRKNRAA
ncbi:VPLPA-CTERM sorting domain-containing protein [Litoreibacter sp.]|nr:VPLPA-CTERM sorting domain-containing protein [Litoreibacter sp.]